MLIKVIEMDEKGKIKELEKKKKKYLNAVVELTILKKEQYELQLEFNEAQIREQKAEWEYWQAINKSYK